MDLVLVDLKYHEKLDQNDAYFDSVCWYIYEDERIKNWQLFWGTNMLGWYEGTLFT